MAIRIISDTACDLPKDLVEKYGVVLVPFGVSYGDGVYFKDYFEVTPMEFHKKLRTTNAYPKTSQPTFMDYEGKIKPYLEQGDDVICFSITSKFSGSHESAYTAVEHLKPEYPKRSIVAIDSLRCTILQGVLVVQACRMRDDGWDFESIVEKCEQIKNMLHLYASVDSLEYLQKGGRVGKANALAGSLLNIKPIITFTDGELHAHSKVRGSKKMINEIFELIVKDVGDRRDDYIITLFCCDEMELANDLKDKLEARFGELDFPMLPIGSVVGAHLGPTGVAVAAIKKYEKV